MKSNYKKISIVILTILIISSGVIYTIYQHNQEVKVEQKERKRATYQALQDEANKQVAQAATDLDKKQIDKANKAISKLDDKDQTPLLDKLAHVSEEVEKIEATQASITKAKNSKTEEDITLAQENINQLSQVNEKQTKEAFQKSLDSIRAESKKIAEEKAVEENHLVASKEEDSNKLTESNALDYVVYYLNSKDYDVEDFTLGAPLSSGPTEEAIQYDITYQEKDGTGAGMFRLRENPKNHQVDITKFIGSQYDTDDFQEITLPS